MYVERNNEARLHNHCCYSKAISMTYSECLFIALDFQHVMLTRRIVNCGLSGSTIFFHIIS
jgi:hypothetical protein